MSSVEHYTADLDEVGSASRLFFEISFLPLLKLREDLLEALERGPISTMDPEETFARSGTWKVLCASYSHLHRVATLPHKDKGPFANRVIGDRGGKSGFCSKEDGVKANTEVFGDPQFLTTCPGMTDAQMKVIAVALQEVKKAPQDFDQANKWFCTMWERLALLGMEVPAWLKIQNAVYDSLGDKLLEVDRPSGSLVLVGTSYCHMMVLRTLKELAQAETAQTSRCFLRVAGK